MKVTGKCKEDFEKWYKIEFENRNLPYKEGFEISDLSIRYGVYVDFFDSVGIYVHSDLLEYGFDMNETIHESQVIINYWKSEPCKNRQEARTKAIEKANEIYNQTK